MKLESDQRIHPRTDGKEGAGIGSKKEFLIADAIARRRSRALVRGGYIALGVRVLALAAALWLVFSFGFLITQVSGQGMFPALKDGDLCVIFRRPTAQLLGEGFQKNDIVAYRVDGQRRFGRVAAIAGDELVISAGGGLTVNGVSQSGEIMFATYPRDGAQYPVTIPEGSVYVLGDHRTDTKDSRDYGPIPLEDVEGKVISILRRRGL